MLRRRSIFRAAWLAGLLAGVALLPGFQARPARAASADEPKPLSTKVFDSYTNCKADGGMKNPEPQDRLCTNRPQHAMAGY
jgi:hypothetical protein